MMMHTNPIALDILLLLATAGILVPLLQRLALSPVLSYLVAGIIIGPYGLSQLASAEDLQALLSINHDGTIHFLGETGVVFLLFIIGLELSPKRLWQLKKLILGMGGLQMVLTTIAIALTAWMFDNSLFVTLLLGGALAMSSTAIVMQMLNEKHATGLPEGRMTFSVLLMQDLAVAPLLVFAGVLADQGNMLTAFTLAFIKGVVAIVVIVAVGAFMLRPLFRLAGRAAGDEAMLALVLLLVAVTAGLTGMAGLSAAMGAFLAGVMLAETEYSHAIETYIAPFKGLLLGIFFMSVGMEFDLQGVIHQAGLLAISVPGLFMVKGMIVYFLARFFGQSWQVSLRTAAFLGQSGEFAFVVIGLALANHLVPQDTGQFMMTVVALSMLFAPMAVALTERLIEKMTPIEEVNNTELKDPSTMEGHILIAGFGRVGRVVAEVMDAEHIPWLAIDKDPIAVSAARKMGLPVWYGDATNTELIQRLRLKKARAAVVATGDMQVTEQLVGALRKAHPEVPLFVRARDRRHVRMMAHVAQARFVPENLELALQISAHVLHLFGVQDDIIRHRLELVRATDPTG